MSLASRSVTILLLALLGVAPGLEAQQAARPWIHDLLEEALDGADATALPGGFGNNELAMAVWSSLRDGKTIQAREIASHLLDQEPESIPGHCLMGLIQHRHEANLPVALFHFRRCRSLFEGRYGDFPGPDAPWFWHALSITELAYVNGEMGRHEEKVNYLLERDSLYEPPMPADRGWPLMRLRRYDEARAAVEAAMATGDMGQISSALTALCAIEAEQLNREQGYEACLKSAEYTRDYSLGHPTPFTNAAEGAMGMLRFGEAERLLLEASEHFRSETVSNPYLDLTLLLLGQGRISEALDSVRRMVDWRRRQPPYMEEQNRAEMEMASATFLIVAGRAQEAAALTSRTLNRPDRTGFTSSESEQMEAAAAILHRAAHQLAAEQLDEQASWLPWRDALRARAAAFQHRLDAWTSGRRAASLVADERMLLTTMRPYLAGSIEVAEWLEPEIVGLVGPGVAAAAVQEARRQETLDEAEGYFLATEAEIAALRGRGEEALEKVEGALATLSGNEALLRARLLVMAGRIAWDRGQAQRAVAYFDQAMQLDPGAVRRQGVALPTSFYSAPTALAKKALGLIDNSPRFDDSKGGFQVRIEGGERGENTGLIALLTSPQGTVLGRAQVTTRAGESNDALVRRLAKDFHDNAFAPRLDLTQADLRTLDGSPTAGGGRSRQQLDSVLTDLVGEEE